MLDGNAELVYNDLVPTTSETKQKRVTERRKNKKSSRKFKKPLDKFRNSGIIGAYERG